MNESKISVRYAKALFESASEKGILDEVREDMEELQQVCVIPEFEYLVVTPVMKESQKCDVVHKIIGNKVNKLTLAMLDLIFRNGREQYLPAIARNYIDLYKKEKGIISASITSAAPLTDMARKQIEKIIRDAFKSPVELVAESNEKLIGGFIIRVDDQQYDASVATNLRKVKKQLLT